MSGVSKGNLGLCVANNNVLPTSLTNDFMMYVTQSNQRMLFGTSNLKTSMVINGTGVVSFSDKVSSTNAFLGSNDSVTRPSFTWMSDSNTGMYRDSTNTIGFVLNGTQHFKMQPGLLSSSNADLSLHGSTRYITLEANNNDLIDTSTVGLTLKNNWARERGLYFEDIDATRSNGYWQIGAKYLTGGPNTKLGIYRDTSNVMEFSTAGNIGIGTVPSITYRLDVAGLVRSSNYYASSNDSVSSPGFSWDGDGTTGIYHQAGGSIGLASYGVEQLKIGNGGISTSNANISLHGGVRSIIIEGSNNTLETYTSGLHIKNNWRREKGIYFENLETSASTEIWHIGSKYRSGNTNANLGFYYGSNIVLENDASGNVGIGKTPSGFKLDTNGTIACRGFTLYQTQ